MNGYKHDYMMIFYMGRVVGCSSELVDRGLNMSYYQLLLVISHIHFFCVWCCRGDVVDGYGFISLLSSFIDAGLFLVL